MSWTDETTERLKDLWAEGLSCSQIARHLGNGFTRNSVIGKITRLGVNARTKEPLSEEAVAERREKHAERAREYRANGRDKAERAPQADTPEPVTNADGSPVTILTVANTGQCKWLLRDSDLSTAPMCGNRAHPGQVWCEFHFAMMGQGGTAAQTLARRAARAARAQSQEAMRVTGLARAFGGAR